MNRLKPGVDVVYDILVAVTEARPQDEFARSILFQYIERGGLSKKQLQGLYGKAKKFTQVSPAKLATLEAIILKKPEKSKSELPVNSPMYKKEPELEAMMETVLSKYPGHKRMLFLKAKYSNNETLTPSEMNEVKKFSQIAVK